MSEKEMPFLEIHKNSHGAKIFKCCMSCGHKEIISVGQRYCKAHNKVVTPYEMCKRWMLAIGLERAGAGGGCVNTQCYQNFKEREQEMYASNLLRKKS